MFYGNSFTSLHDAVTLSSLTDGTDMFHGMFSGNEINTTDYSNLLIRTAAATHNYNVPFNGGKSKYWESGEVARIDLEGDGWTIIDGGLQLSQ